MSAEARLKELGIVLPSVPTPVANYVPYRLVGNLLYLSGQGPRDEKGASLTGKVGKDVTVEEGYRRARLIGLGLLAATRHALGSLARAAAMGRATPAEAQAARTRIDVHHHFMPQFHIDALTKPGRRAGGPPPKWSPALSIEDMDKS